MTTKKLKSKLPLSLIPISTHGQRLSGDLIEQWQWDRIRRWAYQRAGYRCEACGGIGAEHPVEAHEYWRFDDKRRIQILDRVVALCPLCHRTVHLWGMDKQYGVEKTQECIEHLAKLNGWDWMTVQQYVEQETAICAERCEHVYTVNIDIAAQWLAEAMRPPSPWPSKGH